MLLLLYTIGPKSCAMSCKPYATDFRLLSRNRRRVEFLRAYGAERHVTSHCRHALRVTILTSSDKFMAVPKMKVMVLVNATRDSEAGVRSGEQLLTAMGKYRVRACYALSSR
jgi:hypothetical protein